MNSGYGRMGYGYSDCILLKRICTAESRVDYDRRESFAMVKNKRFGGKGRDTRSIGFSVSLNQ